MRNFSDNPSRYLRGRAVLQDLAGPAVDVSSHAALLRGAHKRCPRASRDEVLPPQIQRVWQVNMQVCGADKVWRQLARQGMVAGGCVQHEWLMHKLGLRGVMRDHVVRTAVGDAKAVCPLIGEIDRTGPSGEPTVGLRLHVWRDLAGLAICALVIDVFVRRIVGWLVSSSTRSDFVLDALVQTTAVAA